MQSRIAALARDSLLVDLRRMTAEQRLAAFVAHSQLMLLLYQAGRHARRAKPAQPGRIARDPN